MIIMSTIICQICNFETTTKGISSHLRSAHNITSKEYYDTYIKSSNEGICPICNRTTKYYNFTKGYNKHCSTKCSSLDPEVQTKLRETNLDRYNVEVGYQTTNCIKNSHSKEALDKKYQTSLSKYGKSLVSNSSLKQAHTKQTLLTKYHVTNSYLIPDIRKKALANAQTTTARTRYKVTRLSNGWNKSNIEELFKQELDNLNIDYNYNTKSINYPWRCDFYLKDFDTYIELNLFWTHNFHYFDSNNLDDLNMLNKWKSKNNDYYKRAIDIWTNIDIQKRNHAIANNLNYIVVWTKDQVNQLLDDLKSNNLPSKFYDYNSK